jgi:hypothetical protein
LEGQKNKFLEDFWWARLAAISDSRKKGLRTLIDHDKFRYAFDILHHMPALYNGLRLTTIKKIINENP